MALWASHLALGDAPGETARMAFVAFSRAFEEEERVRSVLSIALAQMERTLSDREVRAPVLPSLTRS